MVQYHKARDWIRQQKWQELTYTSLLTHSEPLESSCEHYQKA